MKNGGYRSSTAQKKAIVVVAHAMIVIIWVRREALSLRMEVKDRPSPRRRSGGVKLEAA
jgi:hypothetical protein